MENKNNTTTKPTRPGPRPTDDNMVLRIRELFAAMDIILGFALHHLGNAQHESDDIELDLYAVEANLATLYDLLHDGTGYANMMH